MPMRPKSIFAALLSSASSMARAYRRRGRSRRAARADTLARVNRLGALVYDRLVMKRSQEAGLADARRDALAPARGRGARDRRRNRAEHPGVPAHGHHAAGADRAARSDAQADRGQARRRAWPVEVVDAAAERLPFEDATFDTVTGTLVLCEADDPAAAVDEIARVLKPGGRYLFLEHVRSDDPALARQQDRWAPLWRAAVGGCNCNRDTLATVAASGLDVERHGSAASRSPPHRQPAAQRRRGARRRALARRPASRTIVVPRRCCRR